MRIIVCGSNGRMGNVICKLAAENPETEVVAGIDVTSETRDFPIFNDINLCDVKADVIISFLPPTANSETLDIVDYCIKHNTPLVICTTGMPKDTESTLNEAAEKIPILRSANMSLGINLLSTLLKRAAQLLYDADFDIEIFERHHNQKIDSPSGTALLLADSIRNALHDKVEYVTDRSTNHEKRAHNEIGLHALRGGTIVGEHSVVFAGRDEVIEFTHIAQSRDVFGVGALRAAKFLQNKSPKMYSMQDLIDF
ncbi:MAG: 4-hydroxy-tetrahydrodipicolinate reductase [Defluviitaleaceae bacterium]|nr:4-hydroxy-tetrahydrodipicolinate reductase [Defluviitaleaceae bacterium]